MEKHCRRAFGYAFILPLAIVFLPSLAKADAVASMAQVPVSWSQVSQGPNLEEEKPAKETKKVTAPGATKTQDVSAPAPAVKSQPKTQTQATSVEVELDEKGNAKISKPTPIKTPVVASQEEDADLNDGEADEMQDVDVDEDVKQPQEEPAQEDLQGSPLHDYDIKNDLQKSPLRQYDIKSDIQSSPLRQYDMKFSGEEANTAVEKAKSFKEYPDKGVAPKFEGKWETPYSDDKKKSNEKDLQNSPLRKYDIHSDIQKSPLNKYATDFEGKESQQIVKKADSSFKPYSGHIDGTFDSDVNDQLVGSGFTSPDPKMVEMNLTVLPGWRKDDIDWNIAGDDSGQNPNILSELTWKNLQSKQLKAKANLVILDHYVVDVTGAYGQIYDGKNQDSDYLGDDRTLEFSRSNNKSDEGDIFDLTGGLGYRLYLGRHTGSMGVDNLWLTFLGGYSHHEQRLVITDGFQTIPADGAFDGLHSNYDTEWKGPWGGFELATSKGRFNGSFRFEYHHVDYTGKGNWNLRTDLEHPVSFLHEADGQGFVYGLLLGYELTDSLDINLAADFQDWNTDHGTDTTMAADGSRPTTRLNEVNWKSQAYMVGGSYHFSLGHGKSKLAMDDDDIY